MQVPEDHGQLLLLRGADEPERGPVPLQSVLVEELDPAQGDRGGCSGDPLLGGQVQEVLAEVLLAEAIGAHVVVRGEAADRGDVTLLRTRGCSGRPSASAELRIVRRCGMCRVGDLMLGAAEGLRDDR